MSSLNAAPYIDCQGVGSCQGLSLKNNNFTNWVYCDAMYSCIDMNQFWAHLMQM